MTAALVRVGLLTSGVTCLHTGDKLPSSASGRWLIPHAGPRSGIIHRAIDESVSLPLHRSQFVLSLRVTDRSLRVINSEWKVFLPRGCSMNHDTDSTLLATIEEWRAILLGLDNDVVRHKPFETRWSICEVIGHLVDSACNNHQRFVRAQESAELTFPKYDQNAWVIAGDYNESDWPSLVTLWYSYNQHLARVIRRIPASKLKTPCTITPNETCTLAFLIDDYLVHLQHHLRKIEERIGAQE